MSPRIEAASAFVLAFEALRVTHGALYALAHPTVQAARRQYIARLRFEAMEHAF